jgi:hypothetical protein
LCQNWDLDILSFLLESKCHTNLNYNLVTNINLSQVTDILYHIMLCRIHHTWAGFEVTTSVVIGTDCIVRSKSIYHTIMTTPKVKITGCTNKIRLYIYMCHHNPDRHDITEILLKMVLNTVNLNLTLFSLSLQALL